MRKLLIVSIPKEESISIQRVKSILDSSQIKTLESPIEKLGVARGNERFRKQIKIIVLNGISRIPLSCRNPFQFYGHFGRISVILSVAPSV